MTVRFVEEAQQEFLDAISFYEEARAGLGRRFKEQVDRSVRWIADHPELYRYVRAVIAASISKRFHITTLTSSETVRCGCLQ